MRLVYKTISYGLVHIIVATAVAYLITGNLAMALGIGLIEPIVQTGVFALHDYVWERDAHKRTHPFCLEHFIKYHSLKAHKH